MIQFNLLPDVKLEYIKARRLKRTVIFTSVVVAGSALTILVLLFLGVAVLQKQHMKHLSDDITADTKKLNQVQDLNKILTVQNQLNSLPDLHAKKPVTSRLFTYIQQLTPQKASISSLDISFDDKTLHIKGSADSISTVNKYVDTLKFTTYVAGDKKDKAFTDVVLSSFTRDDKSASYEITLKFDPIIFDSANDVKLNVPNIISTRSETEKPDPLFQQTGNTEQGR